MFQAKTKGLPDVTLYNEHRKDQLEQYEQTTHFILKKGFEKIITLENQVEKTISKSSKPFENYIIGSTHRQILTKIFQEMCKSLSADEIATELANITKWATKKEKIKEAKIDEQKSAIIYSPIWKF